MSLGWSAYEYIKVWFAKRRSLSLSAAMDATEVVSPLTNLNGSEVLHNNSYTSENTTQADLTADDIVRMCPHDSLERCYSAYEWKYFVVGLCLISLVVNIFHILVLRRLPSIRGTAYLFILQQISVADIYAMLSLFSMFCFYHQIYLGKNIIIGVLFATMHEHCGLVRYSVLSAASIERYLTLCHPLGGGPEFFKQWSQPQQIKTFSVGSWIAALVFSFAKNYFLRGDICVWAFYGPGNIGSLKASICLLAYTAVWTAIIFFCNVKVLIELKQVRIRNKHQRIRDKLVRRGFLYIVIINIAFYVCLIPVTATIILSPFEKYVVNVRWFVHVLYMSYGIFNVVTYGWAMKPYRTLVCKILMCTQLSKTESIHIPSVTPKTPKAQESELN